MPMTLDRTISVTTSIVSRYWNQTSPVATEWWLDVDGTTVAYLKTLTYDDERHTGARFVLCNIEVREGHRGNGYVGEILARAQAEAGLVLHTNGGYTPKGAAALMGRLAILPGHTEGVKWEDMTFVHDWDAKIGPR